MKVYERDRVNLEGVHGDRYWIDLPFKLTGVPEIDQKLGHFPIIIFTPEQRNSRETPVVIALQGVCTPYIWNYFIVPTLISMGIAVILIETPLAGYRSLIRTHKADVIGELKPLIYRGIKINSEFLLRVFRCVVRDINEVLAFARRQYQLYDPRLAFFGVSMGVLYSSSAFTECGIGQRLLGVVGHSNLQTFADSWIKGQAGRLSVLTNVMNSPLKEPIESLLNQFQPKLLPFLSILDLVNGLKRSDQFAQVCNPINYVTQVDSNRRVRFLVGDADPLVRVQDTHHCAKEFPNANVYIVPDMNHGWMNDESNFEDHVRSFLKTELADWSV